MNVSPQTQVVEGGQLAKVLLQDRKTRVRKRLEKEEGISLQSFALKQLKIYLFLPREPLPLRPPGNTTSYLKE